MKTYIYITLLLGVLVHSGCRKDEPYKTPASDCYPALGDADGVLTATIINSIKPGTIIDTAFSTSAEAWFLNCSHTTYIGNVTCNSQELHTEGPMHISFSTYTTWIWHPNFTDSGYIHWYVEGNGSYNIPSFNFITNDTFPELNNFMIPDSIAFGNDLVIKFNKLLAYDSLQLILTGTTDGNGLSGTYAGSWLTSTDFNSDSLEVSWQDILINLGRAKHLGYTISAMALEKETFGDRVFYFIKSRSYCGTIHIKQ